MQSISFILYYLIVIIGTFNLTPPSLLDCRSLIRSPVLHKQKNRLTFKSLFSQNESIIFLLPITNNHSNLALFYLGYDG